MPTELKPEFNYYPLIFEIAQEKDAPQMNMPAVALAFSNIIPTGGGSVIVGGAMQSPNYIKGKSGYIFRADGSIESYETRGALDRDDFHWFTMFESSDGYAKTGTVSAGSNDIIIQTGSVSNDTATLRKGAENLAPSVMTWTKNRRFRTRAHFETDTSQEIYITLGGTTSVHAGFYISNNSLYGSVYDTSQHLTTVLKTIVAPIDYTLEMRLYVKERKIKFYIDDILAATSSNMPVDNDVAEYTLIRIYVKTLTGASREVVLSYWDFWQAS